MPSPGVAFGPDGASLVWSLGAERQYLITETKISSAEYPPLSDIAPAAFAEECEIDEQFGAGRPAESRAAGWSRWLSMGMPAARATGPTRPRALDKWLFRKFDARHLAKTIDELTAAAKLPPAPVDGPDGEAAARIAACDRKLTGYRAALDAGGDPATISRWITETTAERARLVARTRPKAPRAPMTPCIVTALGDILAVLRDADPADKAEIYSQLGVAASTTLSPAHARGSVTSALGVAGQTRVRRRLA